MTAQRPRQRHTAREKNTIQVRMSLWGKTTQDTTLTRRSGLPESEQSRAEGTGVEQLELRRRGWASGRTRKRK